MHNNIIFDDYSIITNINGKLYSDLGMMQDELADLTGIDLDTLLMYDDWYKLDDNLYYFKHRYVFEELFMSELARECNVRCVDFKLASSDGIIGIISKLYRTNDKQYYMFSDFCKKYFYREVNDLGVFRLLSVITFGEEKIQQLMKDIFDLISFDIFSGQWDRGEYNFFFECGDGNIRLAPLCDNGLIFTEENIYSSPFGYFSLCDLENDEDSKECLRNNLLQLLGFEKKFYEKLASLLDINIDEILKGTIDKYKIILGTDNKKQILDYFDNRKKCIEHTLKLSRNVNG